MKKLLFSNAYYNSIAEDDLISKQRYKLFRTTSLIGSVACLLFVLQITATYSFLHPIVVLTLLIGGAFVSNLIALDKHKNSKISYLIIGVLATLIIHLNMYDQGGLRASASYYMAPITLMIFMLLGNKVGRNVFLLVIANFVYFYFITEYTNIVSWDVIGNTEHDKNLDILITGIFASIILGAQISYLESGKNVVIEKITTQRNELREKNIELNKLSMVASKADNAITITDNLGLVEWVNDGFVRLTGYSSAETIGVNPLTLLRGKGTNTEMLSEIEDAMKNNLPFTGELLKYKKNGKSFWSQITMTPIASDGANSEQFIFIESDITPRKIAEERMQQYNVNLEKSYKELDKFAYVVSHDLKAPLRAIGNLTGWIEEDMADRLPEDVRGHFNIIKGRVVRMEGLINGILDYTKAAKNGGELQKFNSEDIIRESIDLIGVPSNAVIHIRENMPQMEAEKVKLQQIFMNLINNAVKYNDKQDIQVDIACEDLGAEYKFSIKDNGPGIESKYHEKIFVIFQTLNARDEVEARGVGLAIVKKIIEEEGGRIWVESEKGEGSNFCFTWPKVHRSANTIELTYEYELS